LKRGQNSEIWPNKGQPGNPGVHFPECLFDHSSVWWFSRNRVTWPGKWVDELT